MENKKCIKCGHEWIARMENPRMCPRCKNYNWDKAKEEIKESVQPKSSEGVIEQG